MRHTVSVRTDGRRAPQRRKRSSEERRSHLGDLLADLRAARGFTLRQVEEATGNAVSNAYLSQLEKGKVQKPSPNVLHSLAAVYAVPYESLMEKVGYLPPVPESEGKRRRRLSAFALADLSAEEEAELLKYLAFIRSR
jgi:HTH-type transcriptional regulator, competence development regulator